MATHVSEYFIPGQLTGCRLGTTAAITATYNNGSNGIGATLTTSAPTLTVNTVLVKNGDSIFVAHQTNGWENGIYVVSGVGVRVVLTRRTDFHQPEQMVPGFFCTLAAGSFAGLILTIIEPQVQQVGVDVLYNANSAGT